MGKKNPVPVKPGAFDVKNRSKSRANDAFDSIVVILGGQLLVLLSHINFKLSMKKVR